MDDIKHSETSLTFAVPTWEFTKLGSEAAQQVCNQGQTVAKAMTDWNAECHRFVSHRMSRNGDAVMKIAKSQSLPEMLAIQAKWLQVAVEDYLSETSMLMEMNSKLLCGLMPQVGQAFQSSAKAPTRRNQTSS
jgi:hypothetical protein